MNKKLIIVLLIAISLLVLPTVKAGVITGIDNPTLELSNTSFSQIRATQLADNFDVRVLFRNDDTGTLYTLEQIKTLIDFKWDIQRQSTNKFKFGFNFTTPPSLPLNTLGSMIILANISTPITVTHTATELSFTTGKLTFNFTDVLNQFTISTGTLNGLKYLKLQRRFNASQTVVVDPTVIGTYYGSWQELGIARRPTDGSLWSYLRSTAGSLLIYNSTNNGTTWNLFQNITGVGTICSGGGISVKNDGTIIFTYCDDSPSYTLHYYNITKDNVLSTVVNAYTTGSGQNGYHILPLRDGTGIVQGEQTQTFYSLNSGSTWTAGASIVNYSIYGSITQLLNGSIVRFNTDERGGSGTYDLVYQILSNPPTSGTERKITTNMTQYQGITDRTSADAYGNTLYTFAFAQLAGDTYRSPYVCIINSTVQFCTRITSALSEDYSWTPTIIHDTSTPANFYAFGSSQSSQTCDMFNTTTPWDGTSWTRTVIATTCTILYPRGHYEWILGDKLNFTDSPNIDYIYRNTTDNKIYSGFVLMNFPIIPPSFTILNVSVFTPNGTAIPSWAINVTNLAGDSFQTTGSNPLEIVNSTSSFPSGLVTINVSAQDYDSAITTTTINFTSNTTQFFNFTLYPIQSFRYNVSGSFINNFNLQLKNSTTTQNYATTTGILNISTRNSVRNSVTATGNSFGTVTSTLSITLNNNTPPTNYIFSTTGSIFTLSVYSEESMEPLNNITAIFLTSTTGFNVTFSPFNGTITIPVNNLTGGLNSIGVTFIGNTRWYYRTIQDNSSQSLSAFFPTTGSNYYYNIRTVYVDIPINGSFVQVQRFVNGTYRTVAEGRTAGDGSFPIFASANQYYYIIASNPLYRTTSIFQLFGLVNFNIDVQLAPSGDVQAPLQTPFSFFSRNISIFVQPNVTYVKVGVTTNTTISDSESLLNYVEYSIRRFNISNTTTYYSTNVSASSGYTFSVPLNYTKSTYTITMCWMRNGTTYQCFQNQYITQNLTNWFDAQAVEDSGGLSVRFFQIVALFLMIALCALLFPFLGVYVVFLLPILSVVFMFMNIFQPLETIAIIIISIISIMAILR
jgi:hypothetical protein